MKEHANTINKILWDWGDIQAAELSDICKDFPLKLVRWLVTHHPDNRTRKHLLRLSTVYCGKGSVINSRFVVSDDYKPIFTIGERVAISPNVTVICASVPNNSRHARLQVVEHRFIKSTSVLIGDDSRIGAGAILIPGVEIGKREIVGAGEEVTERISPPYGSNGCPSENPSISQARFDTTSWVVLFGGAGRQNVISHMQAKGLTIIKVIVPVKRSQRLDEATIQLKDKGFDVVEVSKSNLAECLDSLSAYALISLGFPYIIARENFEKHPLALNVHPTLLPKYRGPSSGAYILINGEEKSGSTVHLMTEKVDKGAIVLQREVPISPFDTIISMQQKVYRIEPQLVIDAIEKVNQCATFVEQNENDASFYPKLRKPEDSQIDPLRPLLYLINEIRACDPKNFPAFFFYHGQKVGIKLWRIEKTEDEYDEI